MKKIGETISYIEKGLNVQGVAGFGVKFSVILLIYCASAIFLFQDPFFKQNGEFVFQQGIALLIFAIILLNTVYWDLQLFGRPSGANLLLQIASWVPGSLLVARIFGNPTKFEQVTLIESVFKNIVDTMDKVIPVKWLSLPKWMTDMVSNWKVSIIAVLLLLILSLNIKKQIKVGAIVLILFVPWLTEIASGASKDINIIPLILSTILFAIALTMQFCDYDVSIYFEKIDESFRQSPFVDPVLLRSTLRIMTRLFREEKLSEQHVHEIIAEEYNTARGVGNGYDDLEMNQIAVGVTKKMIYNFDLVNIQQSSNGAIMLPNRRLFVDNSMLRGIAIWPRMLVVVVFAIIWCISPFDPIPDAIPVLGAFDDFIVGSITMMICAKTVQQEKTLTNS